MTYIQPIETSRQGVARSRNINTLVRLINARTEACASALRNCPPAKTELAQYPVREAPRQRFGYTFRPRGAKNRYGKLFDSFLPAVSMDATKKMLRTIKSWKLSSQTLASIGELAAQYLREARVQLPWPTEPQGATPLAY
jgi:hypothetical protein